MRDSFIIDDSEMATPSIREALGEWHYQIYSGKPISKIKITSTKPKTMTPKPGEIAKQALTIRADGRVALTTYENKGVDYSAMDSRNYDYPMADVERVIKDISAFFEETHDKDLVEGAGQWEIVITDTDDVRFKENGSMGHGSDMTEISRVIRDVLDNELFLFDGQVK